MRGKLLSAVICLFFFSSHWTLADTIKKPYTFSNKTIADADEVNANFDAIISQLNKFGGAISIDRSGNMGIGTSRPLELLDLTRKDKDVFFNIDAGILKYNSGIRIRAAGDLRWAIMFRYSESEDLHIRDEYAGSDVMTFQFKSGNIGINNTDPGYTLDIDGNLNFSGDIYQNGKLFSGGSGSSLWTESKGNIYYTAGKIGVGTSTPGYSLDVGGDINLTGDIYQNGKLFSGGSGSSLWTESKGNIYYTAGKIGIGTSTPGYNLDVSGYVNSDTGYLTRGKDYAEYFKNEENLVPGDIAGINLETGNIRKYRAGDELVGIVSDDAGYIGNNARGRKNDPKYTLVGLMGQLDFDETQVKIKGRVVTTKDGVKIGVLLSSGKVFIK